MEMKQASIVDSEFETISAIAMAEPNQELCKFAQLPPFSPDQAEEMVKIRKDLPPDLLAVFTRNLIGHYGKGLYKISRPFLQEVKRCFTNLDRTKQDNDTYREIDGARSFDAWLKLHKIGKRNAYYILAGGIPDKETGGVRRGQRKRRMARSFSKPLAQSKKTYADRRSRATTSNGKLFTSRSNFTQFIGRFGIASSSSLPKTSVSPTFPSPVKSRIWRK